MKGLVGNRLCSILLVLFAAVVAIALPAHAADRVALVIGNNEYPKDSNFHPLNNCVNDANLIAKTLRTVGFEVTLLTNATRGEMDDALLKFEGDIKKGGTALVYFAGHGIEYEGKNYLMGSNARFLARSRLGEEALMADTFAAALVQAGAASSFLLLDCCRELPANAEWAARGQKRFGLADIAIDGDVVIGMAAAPGKPALEPREAGGNSPYALALAKWLPSGLKHTDLFAEVRREVDRVTEGRQRTWENGSFLNDFYFVEKGEAEKPANRELMAKLEEMQQRNAELENALANRDTSEAELQRLRARLAEATKEADESMKRTEPEVTTKTLPTGVGYSASRGMEGSKAGETRTFGGIEFVWCPPTGEEGFLMGSPADEEDRGEDESQHRVILTKGFWMAKTECTQGQWENALGRNPSKLAGSKDLPVEQVSWEDVKGWLSKMNDRYPLPEGWEWALPTEAQWEYACRGGMETVFAFGDSLGSMQANFNGDYPYGRAAKGQYSLKTSEVGSYEANEWGLLDMHGNVWEWCADGYGGYAPGVATNPKGATYGEYRVFRGGSWSSFGHNCRSADRDRRGPVYRNYDLGFRPAVRSTR